LLLEQPRIVLGLEGAEPLRSQVSPHGEGDHHQHDASDTAADNDDSVDRHGYAI
jgi:hypothetical protein